VTRQLNATQPRLSAAACSGSACVLGLMQMPENITQIIAENNNNSNNTHCDIYDAVIMAQSHCESSPGSFGECKMGAGWPPNTQTKTTDMGCLPINGSYHPHPPPPFIIITQPES